MPIKETRNLNLSPTSAALCGDNVIKHAYQRKLFKGITKTEASLLIENVLVKSIGYQCKHVKYQIALLR